MTTGGQTTSLTYTSDGQISSRGSESLSWDGRGRHSGGSFSSGTLTYGFDASGNRRLRAASGQTAHYLLSGLFETDAAGTVTLTDVDGAAGDLAHYSGPPATGSAVAFLYYNGHGDLAAEADASGARTANYTYDPFGALRSGTAPANATSERWTGGWDKKLDTTSSLIEMGARPYDGSFGRFYALDPAEGGSLNGYDYAGQDPVNNLDLDGTCFRTGQASLNVHVKGRGFRARRCAEVWALWTQCMEEQITGVFDSYFAQSESCFRWVGQLFRDKRGYKQEDIDDLWEEEEIETGHFSTEKCIKGAIGAALGWSVGSNAKKRHGNKFPLPKKAWSPWSLALSAVGGCLLYQGR